jgi:hypothetical protein
MEIESANLYSDLLIVASQLDAQHSTSKMLTMAGSALAALGTGALMLSPTGLFTVPAMGLAATGFFTSAGTKFVTSYTETCAIKEACEKWETFRKSHDIQAEISAPAMKDDVMKEIVLKAANCLFSEEKSAEELQTKLEEISKTVLDTEVSGLEKYREMAANYLAEKTTIPPAAMVTVREIFRELLQTSDISSINISPHLASALAAIPAILNRAVLTWTLMDLIKTSLDLYTNKSMKKPGDFLRQIASQLYGIIGNKENPTTIDEDGWEVV